MANLIRNPPVPSAHTLLAGVDVASFQGPPGDWTKVAGNISWAAVKLTELEPNGTKYVNPDAAADWGWLQANHKGRIAYFFGHPSVSATASVDFFISEVTRLGLRDSDAVALDLEVTDGKTAAEVSSWADNVQAQLRTKLSRSPLLYTFRSFATEGNCAGLGGYPLWIADPSSPMGHPVVPAPWTTWAIHQYDISGSIDRDVANYASLADMSAALGKHKEPNLQNLGGDFVGALNSARWANGTMIVVGLGHNGFIQANLWEVDRWVGWKNVSPAKAKGAATVTTWEPGNARLFYIDQSNSCIMLFSANYGKSWG